MEARVGSEGHGFYGMGAMDLRAAGKRSLEWDLNDWNWDGDLFIANRVNSIPSRQFIPIPEVVPVIGNSVDNSSFFDRNLENARGKRELEKRRREIMVDDENQNNEDVSGLGLELGGNDYPISEREVGSCGKKTKLAGGSTSRAVCQVVDCGVDLSNAKDYHRRHKVCEKHSKASRALVGNLMQRFCQQCSRFHVLQEFDEGKRSCRRRLAGHNRRRRKANSDAAKNGSTLNNDQSSSYLLKSLLKILSNMHSIRSEQATDQDLLSHLLRSLAGYSGEHGGRNVPISPQEPRNSLTDGVSPGNSEEVRACDPNGATIHASSMLKSNAPKNYAAYSEVREDAAGWVKMNNFDLNNLYIDSDDGSDEMNRCPIPMNTQASSLDCPSWVQDSHQSSPPQTSGNSDSASAPSPSNSDGDAQSRTDRIVFKLFGKEPNHFPLVLREQVLDWLLHSPTDMESYIRPGCIVLTIYLRQPEAAWDELCYDLSSSLDRLLDVPDATFWKTGWLYIRVQHQIAFIYNGQVVVDRSLTPTIDNFGQILSVKPIALCASERAQINVKGINMSRASTRLLCAINGNYMALENTEELMDDTDKGHNELQCVKFSCSIPTLTGRGFIEIEDQGLSSSFFPFIVAEDDVCLEICMLEDVLELTDNADSGKARSQAMDFIHEMGWLLHRSQLKSRLGRLYPTTQLFTLERFKWLMEFSMDHEWCAVVKKLMDILLNGNVGIGDQSSVDLALSEMSLLHRAVRRNSKPLVEVLLRYVPDKLEARSNDQVGGSNGGLLFRPDMTGPAGLTPLHIAAGKDGSEDVLDALTDDPGMVGVEAWKNARDSTGSTPEDYARLRGHYSYIHLVQKKIKRRPVAGHVVVDIPDTLSDTNVNQKQNEGTTTTFEIGQRSSGPIMNNCEHCYQKPIFGTASRSQLYRPAMLSMVAIAAVCVCVALLFKSCPEVIYIFRPFRWELLDYGTI